ncbi:MAG: alkaline phosphatase family protein, partial [Bacillota bacterium]
MNSRGIMVIVCVVLMVLLGVFSWHLARMGLEGVAGYRSPYAFDIQPGAGTERLTRRLVLIIIDGLGFSGVDEMPTLKDIGSRGVAFSLVVKEPSLSYPGWTTLLTGAPPEISGVATNAYQDRVVVDSLFGSATRAGIKAVVAGDEGWKTLFGSSVTRGAYYETSSEAASKQADDAVLEDTLKELKRGEAELIVAHFSSVDLAGHASGARSSAYRSQAAQADARLSKILSALDLTSTTIVVTSDHGHTARGGHGGWEREATLVPFVAAGAGIVAPEEPREGIEWTGARHVDVAPTCAALLGISVPAHSQGVVLFEALDAPEHLVSERAIRQAQAREAFGALYCSALRAKPPAAGRLYDAMLLHNDAEYGKAAEVALQTDREILDTMARARQKLLGSRRLTSVPASALVLGILALGAVLLGNMKAADMKIPALGAASYFALFNALVFARGIAWSLSM